MMIPREGLNTPVESIGTWASHADEDVLRPTPNKEGVEPGGNDLASMQSFKRVSEKMEIGKRQSLDLTSPVHAYLFGFIQTDGHLSKGTRNRGKLRIEIGYKDADVLEELASAIPYHTCISTRVRPTNFSPEYRSAVLNVYAREFRDELVSLGMKYGQKSEMIEAPQCEYAKADYFRGVMDGDGSLGFTANGFPFVALCTASEKLAIAYELFVRQITGKQKKLARNSRDGVFNITLYKEDAQAIAATLYYEGCVSISRKRQMAFAIRSWTRPDGMRRVPQKKFWTDEQDTYILGRIIEESAAALGRSAQSIKMRLWRLHSSNK